MPYETPLTSFSLQPPSSPSPSQVSLVQTGVPDERAFAYTVTLLSQNQLRIVVARTDSPGTMESALRREEDMPRAEMKGMQVSPLSEPGGHGRDQLAGGSTRTRVEH